MKFSLLNCLFLFVAVAAIIVWQVDKSRFESTLANYGEELPDPHYSEIDGANVADSFCIGDVSFVILQDDISPIREPASSLANIAPPSSAEKIGRPPEATMALIKSLLYDHHLSFEEATVFDYGDEGHFWRVAWLLFPSNGGFSGAPYRYIGFVRGDGTRVAPRIFLRDHFGSWYSNQGEIIFSVLSIDELVAVDGTQPEQQKLITAAEAALNAKLKAIKVSTQFRFESVTRRLFSGKLKREPVDDQLEVWAVDFVDKSIPNNINNVNSATRITIWVTSDLKTSELSIGSWAIEK